VVSGRVSKRLMAECIRCCHYASMAIQITIRNVSEKTRDELAARAALQGKSMQEYLRGELERIAGRPSAEAWLRSVRERKDAAGTRVSASKILSARDADRK
jgi:antitoxin FitA